MNVLTKPKRKLDKAKKVITKFRPQLRTKHPSYNWLRENLPLFPFRSLVRFGSTTTLREAYPTKTPEQLAKIKEINSVQAVKNSANKLLMKQCFTNAGVSTAEWFTFRNNTLHGEICFVRNDNHNTDNIVSILSLPYPIIAKSLYGSRGEGNYKLNTQEELQQWINGKNLSNYIFEKFYSYTREYRIHCTADGYFYTCRKMLKRDAPEDNKWQRHDDNCVWILEENEAFDKPVNWKQITDDCVKALKAVGLDIGGFDVKVQSARDKKGNIRTSPEYIIIECNSACSMGEITQIKYKEALINILSK
jgi:glutathione synthase/RimK-type ligase-like ATP-grasp enzyme